MSFGQWCKIGAIICFILQACLLGTLIAMAHHDYTTHTQQEHAK